MWAYQMISPGSLIEVDASEPAAESLQLGEVLLRTVAGGICGSDVPKFLGSRRTDVPDQEGPTTARIGLPLHEIVGDVVASRDGSVGVGSRVVGWACHSDGLAEYVLTSGTGLVALPDGWPPTSGVLAQPLACVNYALSRVSVRGRSVAVIGVGAIGALFAGVARSHGAARVIGIDATDRTGLDPRLGFDEVIHASSREWSQELDDQDRPDVVIEAVGHQSATLDDAIAAAGTGGTVLCFGIPDEDVYPVDIERIMRKNLTLVGGITRDRVLHLHRAVEILSARPWMPEALITHRFAFADVQRAYEVACQWSPDRLKVVIDLSRE